MRGDLGRRSAPVRDLRRRIRADATARGAPACVVEGPRAVHDALAHGASVLAAAVSPRLARSPLAPAIRGALARSATPLEVTDEALDALSLTRAHQGVVLLVPRPSADGLPAGRGVPVLVAWEVQDPGNAGSLARIAAGAGAAALVLARAPGGAGADPFAPRAVRASAAACLRLAVHDWLGDAASLADGLRGAGFRLVACVPRGGAAPESVGLTGSTALVLGSETRGLPEPLQQHGALLTIPLGSAVESLGVAAAAAVVAFEAARQARADSTTSAREV